MPGFTPLAAGDMTEIVTLRKPGVVADGLGQHTVYDIVADVAARVEPLRGRDFFSAGSMQSPASVRVSIHYRPDVLASWRLDWMGRALELVADPIDVDARHAHLELMCQGVPL